MKIIAILSLLVLSACIPTLNELGTPLEIFAKLSKYPLPPEFNLSEYKMLGNGFFGSVFRYSETEALKLTRMLRPLTEDSDKSPSEMHNLLVQAGADKATREFIGPLFYEIAVIEELKETLEGKEVLEYIDIPKNIYFDPARANIYYLKSYLDTTLKAYIQDINREVKDSKQFLKENRDTMISLLHSFIKPLKMLHEQGYSHNDFKSDNVMFDTSGKVMLIDMGLVSNIKKEADSNNTVMLGSPWLGGREAVIEGFNLHSEGVDVFSAAKLFIALCDLKVEWYLLYRERFANGLKFKDDFNIGPQFYLLQPDFNDNLASLFEDKCSPILDVVTPELFRKMTRIDPDDRISMSEVFSEMEANYSKEIPAFNYKTVKLKLN